ncbi:MAG: zf-HC2 domain-containing protein [Micromonosporaceae bacterium]
MTPACVEARQALGVYVVGAIDPAERAFVDRHLAGCGECRDELAGLAGLPALLGRVTLEEVERGSVEAEHAGPPPERLLTSMLDTARRRRAQRRRNVVLAVAASAVVLVGAGAGAEALISGPAVVAQHSPQGPRWEVVSHTDAATNVSAQVKYVQREWGTETSVWVSGVPYGTKCDLWAMSSSGQRTLVGSWRYEDERAWYPGSTAVAAASIKSFQITAHGKTLVTVAAT